MPKTNRYNPEGTHLWCPTCKTYKLPEDFNKLARSPVGRGWQCRSCANIRGRCQHYQYRYGITEQQKFDMIEQHDNKCAVCGRTMTDKKGSRQAVIDHCHTTGKVRDILCDRCNTALGQVEEDITLCEKLIEYIRKHK